MLELTEIACCTHARPIDEGSSAVHEEVDVVRNCVQRAYLCVHEGLCSLFASRLQCEYNEKLRRDILKGVAAAWASQALSGNSVAGEDNEALVMLRASKAWAGFSMK